MTPTIPSVRSRLMAAASAFALGFGLANWAIFAITGPDRILWVVVAGVFMATAAWGVVVADSPRRLSVWAVLGLEIFIVFTVLPLIWMVALATGDGTVPEAVWPRSPSLDGFAALAEDDVLADAAVRSVGAAALACLVAVVPALAVAVVLARTRWRPRRAVQAVLFLAVLVPTVALAVGTGDLVLRVGGPLGGLPLVRVAVVQLAVALPLTAWVFTAALRSAPWSLVEAARADGAGRLTVARRVLLPTVGPALLVGSLLSMVVVAQDFALSASVTSGEATTLPVVLLDRAADPASTALVAAAGLAWTVPVAVLALVAPRTITRILGEGSSR